MPAPTAEQLQAFFGALEQLRTIYGQVSINFRGQNPLPEVAVSWTPGNVVAARIVSASDSVDDLTTAMGALYAEAVHEGELRQQLADLEKQANALRVQLGIR